ncbi:MAG TPA: 4Fe-4S dicluster domain-containing protein [Anaerolineales bacterium]|nr:4Fe-4S dicluster domain-containing protein [Anaerolineales bacterium]
MGNAERPLSRRGFLLTAGAGAGAGAAASGASLRKLAMEGPHPGDPGAGPQRWVMVIDLARCDGCGECTRACSAMHLVPTGQEWIKVYSMAHDPLTRPYFFPRPCMQCDNPPCVHVCPVGASYKREDGVVLIDQDRCIGCRFCLAACPYSARYFNWSEPAHSDWELGQAYSVETNIPHRRGVAEKCVFCPALTSQGQLPACASACPQGAIFFGDEHEDAVTNAFGETFRLGELLTAGAAHRHLEELGTEPRVWYLPPRTLSVRPEEG